MEIIRYDECLNFESNWKQFHRNYNLVFEKLSIISDNWFKQANFTKHTFRRAYSLLRRRRTIKKFFKCFLEYRHNWLIITYLQSKIIVWYISNKKYTKYLRFWVNNSSCMISINFFRVFQNDEL